MSLSMSLKGSIEPGLADPGAGFEVVFGAAALPLLTVGMGGTGAI